MRNRSIITGLLASTALWVVSCGGGDVAPKELEPPVLATNHYDTADQMLLANEINESGEPFAEALGYDLDQLDPALPGNPDDKAYVLGIENYEFSRYQLGTVISRSGIGLHLMWAPIIKQMAAMQPEEFDGSMTGQPNGVKEDDMLMKNIMMFSTQSGNPPPGHPWPQFAEFAGGDPHLPQAVDPDKFAWEDFATLRWDRSKMDKVLNPAAMGQTLMKQYLWAQDMLSAFHNGADEGIEADGVVSPDKADSPEFDPDNDVYLGGSSLDGFIGLVLTAEAINKVAFIKGALAYDGTALGSIDLATYDPQNGIQYFPTAIAVTEGPSQEGLPPMVTNLSVTDPDSRLFDQASLLWGITSFADMMKPGDESDSAHRAYRHVFDGNPFPGAMSETGQAGPYDLMMGTSKAIFMNLLAMHRDPDASVFVERARIESGQVSRDSEVTMLGSAYFIVALESFLGVFEGTPLEAMARQAVADQAAFVITNLSDAAGGYAGSVTIGGQTTGTGDVEAQAAAVRALFVAARVTGDDSIRTAALQAYQVLVEDYYIEDQKLFATSLGAYKAVYGPRTVALLAGALREATLEGGRSEASDIYVTFFMRVAEAMQLSEGAATGETGGDSDADGIPYIPEQPDRLPPIFAEKAEFDLQN